MTLDRYVHIKLPGGHRIDEYWSDAVFLEHRGVLDDIILYSWPESIADLHIQAEGICTALGGSTAASRPSVSKYSIDTWCQAAKNGGNRDGYGFGNEWFPIVVNDRTTGISASVMLRWAPNEIDYSRPCTLMLDIAWPLGFHPAKTSK
jgi:hypothetical protein